MTPYCDDLLFFSIHYMRDIDEAGVLTPPPHEHAVLWNAMIHPLLNLTIYGAIWYQGKESVFVHVLTDRLGC